METWNLLQQFLKESPQKDKNLVEFIRDNNLLSPISIKNELENFFDVAEKSLGKTPNKSSLLLENSHIKVADHLEMTNLLPALIIDAGGTNLRIVGLINANGKLVYDFYEKKKIPGLKKAIGAEEFFEQLASFVVPVLKKPPFAKLKQIKFCFSYPFTIDENKEARAETLSKEIRIDGIEKTPLGSSLKRHIDWQMPENHLEEIIVLNDTVATLLASYIDNPLKKNHRLGIVIGTGFNIAYQKQPEINGEQEIINTEIGRLSLLCHNLIDKEVDQNSLTPGQSILEKGISGAYLGKWAYHCLNFAACKGLIEKETIGEINSSLKVEEITNWLFPSEENPSGENFSSEEKTASSLASIDPRSENGKRIGTLLSMTVFRSASLAAFATYALIQWMSETKKPSHVVLSVNGSIITKTPKYLENYQKNIGLLSDNSIQMETAIVKDAPTRGSLYAQNTK